MRLFHIVLLQSLLHRTYLQYDEIADELLNFHSLFHPAFKRYEQIKSSTTYLKGLLSDVERKHVEGIALRFEGPENVRGMQKFMTDSPWDDKFVGEVYREELSGDISSLDGMFTINSSENPKKGNESVGVSRQYCGNTGKIENCQSGVFLGYASSLGYGLVDTRLYLPEKWFSDEYREKRIKCRIPNEITFQTKHEIALELLKNAQKENLFKGKWVGVDGFFGSNSDFCDAIENMELLYFAGIRSNQLFWLEKPQMIPVQYQGRGRKPHEDTLKPDTDAQSAIQIASMETLKWKPVILADGAKGPIVAQFAALRVIRNNEGVPGKELWLILRKDEDGKIHYYVSNAPKSIGVDELIRVSTIRWTIEQCFEDGKKHLGMDHYEQRTWTAWNRHMLFVFLAMYFLLRLRIKYKKNSIEYIASNKKAGISNIT